MISGPIDRGRGSDYIQIMAWTREDTREVARRRKKKAAERTRRLEERRKEARAHAEVLVKMIAEQDTTVVRVWGFGSVFDERLPFRSSSDIDLAVEGGTILAWKLSQRSPWSVDWVELADQHESIVRAVKENGVLLYER